MTRSKHEENQYQRGHGQRGRRQPGPGRQGCGQPCRTRRQSRPGKSARSQFTALRKCCPIAGTCSPVARSGRTGVSKSAPNRGCAEKHPPPTRRTQRGGSVAKAALGGGAGRHGRGRGGRQRPNWSASRSDSRSHVAGRRRHRRPRPAGNCPRAHQLCCCRLRGEIAEAMSDCATLCCDSVRHLVICPGGGSGRRRPLKRGCPQGRVGSSPTPGTQSVGSAVGLRPCPAWGTTSGTTSSLGHDNTLGGEIQEQFVHLGDSYIWENWEFVWLIVHSLDWE